MLLMLFKALILDFEDFFLWGEEWVDGRGYIGPWQILEKITLGIKDALLVMLLLPEDLADVEPEVTVVPFLLVDISLSA